MQCYGCAMFSTAAKVLCTSAVLIGFSAVGQTSDQAPKAAPLMGVLIKVARAASPNPDVDAGLAVRRGLEARGISRDKIVIRLRDRVAAIAPVLGSAVRDELAAELLERPVVDKVWVVLGVEETRHREVWLYGKGGPPSLVSDRATELDWLLEPLDPLRERFAAQPRGAFVCGKERTPSDKLVTQAAALAGVSPPPVVRRLPSTVCLDVRDPRWPSEPSPDEVVIPGDGSRSWDSMALRLSSAPGVDRVVLWSLLDFPDAEGTWTYRAGALANGAYLYRNDALDVRAQYFVSLREAEAMALREWPLSQLARSMGIPRMAFVSTTNVYAAVGEWPDDVPDGGWKLCIKLPEPQLRALEKKSKTSGHSVSRLVSDALVKFPGPVKASRLNGKGKQVLIYLSPEAWRQVQASTKSLLEDAPALVSDALAFGEAH